MDTLLLVEDDKFTRHLIREQLEGEDIVVLEAISGKRSLEILHQHPVDVILLDLGLPDGNGLDFIPDIRRHSDVPLIIISAEKDETHRITGFERGADDFIPKPFSAGELIVRIKANLRRYRGPHPVSQQIQNHDSQVRFGEWILEPAKFQIYNRSGAAGDLTMREFQVLTKLIENAGHALTREDLCRATKENNYVPTPRAIDVKIARIRKKIGDDADNPQIIRTVRGIGYMFDHGKIEPAS